MAVLVHTTVQTKPTLENINNKPYLHTTIVNTLLKMFTMIVIHISFIHHLQNLTLKTFK